MSNNVISIKIFIEAGEARGGPPLGPVLGQYQIDVNSFCKEFNEKTSNVLKGLPIPVVIKRFENKSYKLYIKKPTINFLVKQLLDDFGTKAIPLVKAYDLVLLIMLIYKKKLLPTSRLVFGTLSSMGIYIKN